MKTKNSFFHPAIFLLICWGVALLLPTAGAAHCDTLSGPVVQDARTALETGDVTPALKWVPANQEKKVRAAFQRALAAKAKSPAEKEKAEMQFFGALVRIHRTGEGAPYTGLKPGDAIEPIIAAADKSLEIGAANDLIKQVNEAVTAGIRQRFDLVVEKKNHAGESVAAGREYVAAYVDFTHYVEGLHQKASVEVGHHQEALKKQHHKKGGPGKAPEHHKH